MTMPIDTFAKLVAPQPATRFFDPEGREAVGVTRGRSENRTEQLLPWSEVLDFVIDDLPARNLRVNRRREKVPSHFHQSEGKTLRPALERLLANGASLIMSAAHRYRPAFRMIVEDYIARTGDPARVNLIASTGSDGALKRHSDPLDLFIVQIVGAKHWTVWAKGAEEGAAPVFEDVLEEGEYLFVPKGFEHICRPVGDRSLHAGFAFANDDYDVWADSLPT